MLAMVVLAAFIGMPGLGADLLNMMAGFRLGWSLEIGITIVLLAITLDRPVKSLGAAGCPRGSSGGTPVLAQACRAADRPTGPLSPTSGWWRNWCLTCRRWATGRACRRGASSMPRSRNSWRSMASGPVTGSIRRFVNVSVLIPFRDGLLWLPTSAFILLGRGVGKLDWRAAFGPGGGGCSFRWWRMSGWWNEAVITLYMVLAAVLLASLIGLPLGIVAARSEKASGAA